MKKVITSERMPIKLWLDDIEEGALQQAKDLANLPFVFKHVAIMPDSHVGYGMPIGGVLATNNVVIPNAVGVDISCGMCATKTSLREIDKESLKKIMSGIRIRIPVGFNHHKEKQSWSGFNNAPEIEIIQQQLESAQYQLGTLGGGNHFIEIQKGSDGFIWLMLHSGSRNFGFKIAKEFHNKAKLLCQKWFSNIPNKDLSFFPKYMREFDDYMTAMNYAINFAKESRRRMMAEIISAVMIVTNSYTKTQTFDINHNYARLENHFGHNVVVHRKGATSAKKGEMGIIPGSQGTKSYIVEGKGNPESFMSCSHGAGRRMGRKQAKRELDFNTEKKLLDNQGIIHSIHSEDNLDEAAGAYKVIGVVMKNQEDLVKIVTELSPLAVIKA